MFASRTICAACRSRLALHLARPVIAGRPSSHRQLSSTGSSPSPATTTTDKLHSRGSKRLRPSRGPSQRDQAAQSRALDLFESTINAAQQADVDSKIDIDGLLRRANQIEETLRREKTGQATPAQTAEECYNIVVEGILAAVEGVDGGRLPQAVEFAAGKAMRKVIDVKFALADNNLPSAAALCKVLAGLGLRKPSRLDPYIALLESLVVRNAPTAVGTSRTAPFNPILLNDLIDCWHDMAPSQQGATATEPTEPSPDASPRVESRAREDPAEILRREFPLLAPYLGPRLVVALIGTQAVLSDPRSEALTQTPNFEALQTTLNSLIEKIDMTRVEYYFSGREKLWEYVHPLVRRGALEAPREEPRPNNSKETEMRREKATYAAWHKKFSALFKFNDTRGLFAAWTELTEPTDDPDRAAELRRFPELFDFIIFQCCSKFGQNQKRIVELNERVLEYMNRIGLKPTVRTFTGMIEGWKLAKRLDRIEGLWKHVVKTHTRLDQNIWSSRIAALGTLGRPNDGVKALEEMNQTWERDVAGGNAAERAVKPGTVSVNAAISGLLRSDRLDAVRTVLAWASDKKIQADIYTYNTLLNYMLKKGMTSEADKVLTSMSAQAIEPDAATFTIILDTAMAEMREQTPAEQRATISRVFADMAACGIKPNQETYGKMLHVLTRDTHSTSDPDDDRVGYAVEAVLAHLRGTGLQLSPEICTILFEFYFARRTPRDWDAIRSLIGDRRSRTRVLGDRTFWETVMRHFHGAGDTAAALEIFYDMNDWGIWASLPVLEPMLRSLVSRRQWDEARKLVTTVQAQTRPAAAEPGARYWKHGFWAMAKENGLMELPKADQV